MNVSNLDLSTAKKNNLKSTLPLMFMLVLLMLATDVQSLLLLKCLPTWFNPFLLYLTKQNESVAPYRELLTQQTTIEAYRMWLCSFFQGLGTSQSFLSLEKAFPCCVKRMAYPVKTVWYLYGTYFQAKRFQRKGYVHSSFLSSNFFLAMKH